MKTHISSNPTEQSANSKQKNKNKSPAALSFDSTAGDVFLCQHLQPLHCLAIKSIIISKKSTIANTESAASIPLKKFANISPKIIPTVNANAAAII